MTSLFIPNQEQAVTFHGKVGLIEGKTLSPEEMKTKTIVIVCHPHSLFGGSMNNKVITTIARAFRDMGYRTVRFNFRGVGASAGEFDKGIGESDDLLEVIKQLRETEGDIPVLLAGFSFGSFVAYHAAQASTPAGLVTIAPPVERYDYSPPYPTCPWLVCIPESDEVVTPSEMIKWAEKIDVPVNIVRFPESSHFFHGKLTDLKDTLIKEFSLE